MNPLAKKVLAILLLTIFATTLYAQGVSGQKSPPSQDMQKLQQEFISLNQQLQKAQYQAYQDPEIMAETEKLTNLIDEKIIKENPAMKDLIEKRDRLIEAIEKAYKSGNHAEIQKIQQEIMQLAQVLKPLLEKVMEDESIKAVEEELMLKIYAKMKVINPEIEKIIARLEEIGREAKRMQ